MSSRDPVLVYFSNYISEQLGIVYAEHNDFQLQKRLDEIATSLGCESREALLKVAMNGIDARFKRLLLDLATNNETSFFRDPQLFKVWPSKILPLLANKEKVKIWSAACSTGQEPLSVAMTIEAWNVSSQSNLRFEIAGTDVSERALTKARAATYTEVDVNRGLTEEHRANFFQRLPDQSFRARESLRSCVTYNNLNLKEPFGFSEPFDLVFCRNVLIYQGVESKIAILKQITETLRPGGWLVLGFGESLLGLSNDYERESVDNVVLYRRKVAA